MKYSGHGVLFFPLEFPVGLEIAITVLFVRRKALDPHESESLYRVENNAHVRIEYTRLENNIHRIDFIFTARNEIEARATATFVRDVIRRTFDFNVTLEPCRTPEIMAEIINQRLERLTRPMHV